MVSHRRFEDDRQGSLTLTEWTSEAELHAFLEEIKPLVVEY